MLGGKKDFIFFSRISNFAVRIQGWPLLLEEGGSHFSLSLVATQAVIAQPAAMISGLAETGGNQSYLIMAWLSLVVFGLASYLRFILKPLQTY